MFKISMTISYIDVIIQGLTNLLALQQLHGDRQPGVGAEALGGGATLGDDDVLYSVGSTHQTQKF